MTKPTRRSNPWRVVHKSDIQATKLALARAKIELEAVHAGNNYPNRRVVRESVLGDINSALDALNALGSTL